MSSPPVAQHNASVRTAGTDPLGESQHASTLTVAQAHMVKTVCASGKYRLASLKSTTESSWSGLGIGRALRRAWAVRICALHSGTGGEVHAA
ncbi:MAG: hypothetical protein CMI29_08395 [Opitutae bacterium]|nr:hypothetical protein [Opitutae bacterium]